MLPYIVLDFSLLPLFCYLGYKYFIKREKIKFPPNKHILAVMIMLLCWFIINIISSFINLEISPHHLFLPARALFLVTAISMFLIDRKFSLDDIFNIFIIAALINTFFVFYQYIILYFGLNLPKLYVTNLPRQEFREIGITTGYVTASVLNAIGCISAFFLSLKYKSLQKYFYFAAFVILITGTMLTGRTGLIIIFVFLLACLLFQDFKAKLKIIAVFFAGIFLLINLYIHAGQTLQYTFRVAFESVFNFVEYGTFQTQSSEDLIENHYKLPTDSKIFIIGEAVDTYEREARTDVGFLQTWYANGIFAMLFAVGSYFYMIFIAPKNRNRAFLTAMIYLGMIIANLKGPFLYSRYIGDIMIILFIANVLSIQKENNFPYINKEI